ncbi:MAG: hypothetical protein QM734_11950 [Cyclobacteriaceae bacterium]
MDNQKATHLFLSRPKLGKHLGNTWATFQRGVYKNYNDVVNSPKPVDNSDNVLPVDPTAGVWVGDAKYKDINGDGKIDSKDLTQIGSPWPKWFGGFTNTFSYKGLI